MLRAAGDVVSKVPPSVFRAVFSTFLRRGHDDQQVATDTIAIAAALPSLGLPAALVWGDADRFQKVSYAHKLARDLSTNVDRIGGGRHFVPEDHPKQVAAAVRSVLERSG